MREVNTFTKEERDAAVRFADAMGLNLVKEDNKKSEAVRFAEAMGLRRAEEPAQKRREEKDHPAGFGKLAPSLG